MKRNLTTFLVIFIFIIVSVDLIFVLKNYVGNEEKMNDPYANNYMAPKESKPGEGRKFVLDTYQTENGFGFRIIVDGEEHYKQSTIPGLDEVKTFQSEEDALKMAQLYHMKLNKIFAPPVITKSEIDSLGIVY